MSMIVFIVKSFFFSRADSYSLRQKPHTSHFFYLFVGEMIRVVCAIYAIIIKDLEMHIDNSNLQWGKSAIRFEPSTQKEENGEQTTDTLYY